MPTEVRTNPSFTGVASPGVIDTPPVRPDPVSSYNHQRRRTQDVQALVSDYLDALNERDAARRRELVQALYTADCTYTDPQVELEGPEQIDGFIEQTHERFPGTTFTLGGPIDAHHSQARFQWHAGPADAPGAYVGFDVIVAEDGRIRNVSGTSRAVTTMK
jgi:hypothetical protein